MLLTPEDLRRIRTKGGRSNIPITPKKSRGLGDTVANVIKKVTFGKVKPCGRCKKRQAKLNKWFPNKTKQGLDTPKTLEGNRQIKDKTV